MIDKDLLTGTVNDAIAGTDLFVVDIRISPDNVITVEVDSPTAVDIDECAAITRKIEEKFDRDTEDYELEVGSAGITSDFKIRAQYTKNIGNECRSAHTRRPQASMACSPLSLRANPPTTASALLSKFQ